MFISIRWRNGSSTVELRGSGGTRSLHMGGNQVHCDWMRLPDQGYLVIVDGHVFDLRVDLGGSRCAVAGRCGRFELQIHDPHRTAVQSDGGGGKEGPQRIVAEMPGKVVRILVKPGETVRPEQGLLVLEAMKMQNQIQAPSAGLVCEVGVTEGCVVNTGDLLVSLI